MDMYQAQLNELSSKLRQQAGQCRTEHEISAALRDGNPAASAPRRGIVARRIPGKSGRFSDAARQSDDGAHYEVSHASALASYNKALAEIDLLVGSPAI